MPAKMMIIFLFLQAMNTIGCGGQGLSKQQNTAGISDVRPKASTTAEANDVEDTFVPGWCEKEIGRSRAEPLTALSPTHIEKCLEKIHSEIQTCGRERQIKVSGIMRIGSDGYVLYADKVGPNFRTVEADCVSITLVEHARFPLLLSKWLNVEYSFVLNPIDPADRISDGDDTKPAPAKKNPEKANFGLPIGRSDTFEHCKDENGQIPQTGSLLKKTIKAVVSGNIEEIRRCYEAQLAAIPDLQGRVVVTFRIDCEGNVAIPIIKESELDNDAVESCMKKAVKTWVFPKPEGGGIVVVTYPFVLTSVPRE